MPLLKNIDLLENAIVDLVYKGRLISRESFMVSNIRHISALKRAGKFIFAAGKSLEKKLSLEFAAQDVLDALGEIDGILGKKFSEGLLDKIFSEFCIGK